MDNEAHWIIYQKRYSLDLDLPDPNPFGYHPVDRSPSSPQPTERNIYDLRQLNFFQRTFLNSLTSPGQVYFSIKPSRREREVKNHFQFLLSMGCSFSGLNAIYGAAGATGEVWVNDNRFRILKQIGGTDASSTVYLVKENLPDGASGLAKKKSIDPSHISADGTYAMKKFMIHSKEQLELVKQEIRVSSQFNHPNLLPLLDHAIISVKGKEDGVQNYEAYLLFPVHLDGTLSELTKIMQAKNEFFPSITVLQIFRQLCAGLKHMHSFDPPHAHNDVRPENVLITQRKGQPPLAMLMDFESARPARRSIRSQSEASQLQEWASEHCSSLYRAPELWDVPSNADIDERTDIWSLGCTLYAIMYGKSPFDYEIDESEGGLKSAVKNAQIKWADGPNPAYPDPLRQFISWMLQPQPAIRPTIDDIIIHVDKLIVKYSS